LGGSGSDTNNAGALQAFTFMPLSYTMTKREHSLAERAAVVMVRQVWSCSTFVRNLSFGSDQGRCGRKQRLLTTMTVNTDDNNNDDRRAWKVFTNLTSH
jgi:hypothetical protein